MASDLFRKSNMSLEGKTNPYAAFGLTQNPFPTKPSVTAGAVDPRLNGSIYLLEIVEVLNSTSSTYSLHRCPKVRKNRTIAFLMDYATRRGRGIGKTAFLYHQRKRIMADLGNAVSNGEQVLFAGVRSPSPNGTCRKFWKFCQLVVESLAESENPIISMALWRLRLFPRSFQIV